MTTCPPLPPFALPLLPGLRKRVHVHMMPICCTILDLVPNIWGCRSAPFNFDFVHTPHSARAVLQKPRRSQLSHRAGLQPPLHLPQRPLHLPQRPQLPSPSGACPKQPHLQQPRHNPMHPGLCPAALLKVQYLQIRRRVGSQAASHQCQARHSNRCVCVCVSVWCAMQPVG